PLIWASGLAGAVIADGSGSRRSDQTSVRPLWKSVGPLRYKHDRILVRSNVHPLEHRYYRTAVRHRDAGNGHHEEGYAKRRYEERGCKEHEYEEHGSEEHGCEDEGHNDDG